MVKRETSYQRVESFLRYPHTVGMNRMIVLPVYFLNCKIMISLCEGETIDSVLDKYYNSKEEKTVPVKIEKVEIPIKKEIPKERRWEIPE